MSIDSNIFNSSLFNNRGAVILHPFTITSDHIISLLMANFRYLTNDFYDEDMEKTIKLPLNGDQFLIINERGTLGGSYKTWIPQRSMARYEDEKLILTRLYSGSTIIVDSATNLVNSNLIDLIREYYSSGKKTSSVLIILATEGVLDKELDVIGNIFKDGSKYIFNYIPCMGLNSIVHNIITLRLPIDIIRGMTLDNKRFQQISNFIYPVHTNKPDFDQVEGGWMTQDILKTLEDTSPKFKHVLDIILHKSKDKHIIYTSMRDRAGLRLLSTLLEYTNIPYIVVDSQEPIPQRIIKILHFNLLTSPCVLLTNNFPDVYVCNVSHVHFVDSVNIDLYYNMIKSIHGIHDISPPKGIPQIQLEREEIWTPDPVDSKTLNIHYYITYIGTHSIDAENYQKFAIMLSQYQQYFDKLVEDSLTLSYNPYLGLFNETDVK